MMQESFEESMALVLALDLAALRATAFGGTTKKMKRSAGHDDDESERSPAAVGYSILKKEIMRMILQNVSYMLQNCTTKAVKLPLKMLICKNGHQSKMYRA